MTEQILQRLEEKMMLLLGEVEDLRKVVERLHQENATLKQDNSGMKFDRENHARKLEDLLSMLEINTPAVSPMAATVGLVAVGQA